MVALATMSETTTALVTLDSATVAELPLLSNLLELYIHDLSSSFPDLEIGPDGRFGYSRLPLYWSEPSLRFPFLIRAGGRLAGFALATRGSPASDDPSVFDVAEFFVLRRYRRSKVTRRFFSSPLQVPCAELAEQDFTFADCAAPRRDAVRA